MATLKVHELVRGAIYREPLSGYRIRVRSFEMNVLGVATKAFCIYHNTVTGRFVEVTLYDDELEPLRPGQGERYATR